MIADPLEGRIKNDLDNSEKLSELNGVKFHKGKLIILRLGRNSPMHKCKLGNCLGSEACNKDPRVW